MVQSGLPAESPLGWGVQCDCKCYWIHDPRLSEHCLLQVGGNRWVTVTACLHWDCYHTAGLSVPTLLESLLAPRMAVDSTASLLMVATESDGSSSYWVGRWGNNCAECMPATGNRMTWHTTLRRQHYTQRTTSPQSASQTLWVQKHLQYVCVRNSIYMNQHTHNTIMFQQNVRT